MQQAIALGTVIDKRYQIQKKIPNTTSNICYLAEDTDQSNRLVVMSFPRMELQTLPGFTSTFEDACQRLLKARLNGLIKVLDHGEYNSQPYAVLQYVTHESLESSLAASKNRSKKMSIDEVLDWARPLAVTLDELHEMDYVHTNVRPGVIFLGQKRQILLGDFITEFAVQRLGAFKQAISSLDIADHLAPEYIKSNYNASYDQYLLATIVYEALAGRSHFHNPGSTEAYRRQVATKFPESLLAHRPELVGASRILGKALERNPVKRFDTCREFVNQLGSAKVNPVFGGDDDKPVTVIRKVLDLDETAPADPIITSIRSNRGAGRKKGLTWLGVLLLGTGAGAYAINHFGGLEQFKSKLSTAWIEMSEEPTKPLVIVPIELSANTPTLSGNVPQIVDKTNSSDGAAGVSRESPSSVVQANKKPADVVVSTDSGSRADTPEKPAKETLAPPATTLSVPQTAGFQPNKTVEAGDEQVVVANVINADSTSPKAVDIDDAVLSSAINLALSEGQAEFISSQAAATKAVADAAASVAKIDEAISRTLQEAEADFMKQTSPAASQEVNAIDPSANNQAVSGQQVASEVNPIADATSDVAGDASNAVPDDSIAVGTEDNTPLSPAEIDAQKLNEQMIAANKLADERAETARLAVEKKKREREARREARKKASEAAKQQVSDDAVKKAEEEANKRREAAQAAAAADKDAVTRAEEVVAAPVAKSFDEMQKERARIQAIRAQKTARINSITKDCVTSGKIHRQVIAGNLPYVKNCLSVGVSPNLTQSNRWSLLHLASLGGYLNMAKLLLAKGAKINAKAADGKTPLDMATDQKKTRLITYLRSRGGVTTR